MTPFPNHWKTILFLLAFLPTLSGGNLPPGFAEVLVAANLDPVAMAAAPDGRIFLAEKYGKVSVIENGILLPEPFWEGEVDNFNERGLSGIAIHPDFDNQPFVYLFYTVKDGQHNRISRVTAAGNHAVTGSETVLLELDPMPGTIHNGGAMLFGPDGNLYVATGDGAQDAAAQSLQSLLGKILRLRPDGTIPPDNPFYQQTTGKYRTIYTLGHRNPFSMTLQPGTGRIFCTEVGSYLYEEVNDILPGRNYGWPLVEGYLNGQIPPAQYQDPLYAYDHGQGCCIVGAAFYEPDNPAFPPEYQGMFFFADYCQGYIKYLDPLDGQVAGTFATDIDRPLNFLAAADGTFYYLARAGMGGGSMVDNTASWNGTLWRIFHTGSGAPFLSVQPQPALVSAGEGVVFQAAASGVEPITWQWQRNGIDIPGADSPAYTLAATVPADSGALFRAIASNPHGADTSHTALLQVTNSLRPEPLILSPAAGGTYRAGDTLFFLGAALDPEEGPLPADRLRWRLDFHHDTHTHPGLGPISGVEQGNLPIPQTGEVSDNVWFRIHLTATDAAGLSRSVYRDVLPEKSELRLLTDPPGLPTYLDGNFRYTPVSVNSVVGLHRHLSAPASLVDDGRFYRFLGWSDGYPAADRILETPDAPLTLTARYESLPVGSGTGLRGYYFNGPGNQEPAFGPSAVFSRLDPTVDFDWGGGSPDPDRLGNDYFLVRWKGYVEPLFDGQYTFHVVADDGIRLQVDNQTVIDAWIPQPPTEWTGTLFLEGGRQYPIQLEYFEEAGGAVCELYWSGEDLARSIIPASQLFPDLPFAGDRLNGRALAAYPNPFRDLLTLAFEGASEGQVRLSVHNNLGQVVRDQVLDLPPGRSTVTLDCADFPAGTYWVRLAEGRGSVLLKIVKTN
jgi:glucose/arabinose dehydrogenase